MIELRSEHGKLMDEVVGHGCNVHLERMDEHWFALIIEDGERRVILDIATPEKYRRKVNAAVYVDERVAEGKSDLPKSGKS